MIESKEERPIGTIGRPKILVVDDIEANLTAMRTLLRRVDVDLMTSTSGNEALSLALDHQFAVVLLDVQMPEMDGFEVATYMRDNPSTRDTPIIFMTASNSDELSQLKGYKSGAIDYIGKPVNEHILLSKIEMFLQLYRNKQQLVVALAEVHRQRQILQATFDAVCDGVIATDNGGRVSWMNPAAERMTGWTTADRQPLETVFPVRTSSGAPANDSLFAERRAGETTPHVMLQLRSNRLLPILFSGSLVRDQHGATVGGVIVFQDASEAYARQLTLIGQVETDSLTGLLNRTGFNKRLSGLIATEQERGSDLALLFGDLDGFKQINDTFGHASGDLILKEVGVRMIRSVRENDVVARWAGDEFAVLMLCENRQVAEQMAARLAETVSKPIDLGADGSSAAVGISIGIAMASQSDWDQVALLEQADRLLYASKNGKKRQPTMTLHRPHARV